MILGRGNTADLSTMGTRRVRAARRAEAGNHKCRCGKTISANKDKCLACAEGRVIEC
jgi:hypothetical protein